MGCWVGGAHTDVALAPGGGQGDLALAFAEPATIPFAEKAEAMAAAHPLHVALQLAIDGRERQAAGMAEPVAAGLQLVVDAHSLVEHKAFAPPLAARLGHVFEVLQDPPLEVVDPPKALLQQVGGGLLAADATGAEQGQGLGLALRHQGPQVLLHPGWEVPKRLGARI
jgi:hypothetical protein